MIRDQYKAILTNGKDYVVSATKQGGYVELEEKDERFFVITERSKNGTMIRDVRIAKADVESLSFTPGG